MSNKQIYSFGNGRADGRGDMKDLLGGKGAGLAEMTRAGIPVPPGFTIATPLCHEYTRNGNRLGRAFDALMRKSLTRLERDSGLTFGDAQRPLLVSVRSGSKFSMPGMMDTILNLGLNDITVRALAALSRNERFAYDCYRRFIMMFSNIVLGVSKEIFEHPLDALKQRRSLKSDSEVPAEDLKRLVEEYKTLFKRETKSEFPQDPWTQLVQARDAVFRSWNNKRAVTYRKMNGIPDDLGTAVNVQAMVFGNLGDTSGTGVGFTRDPSTGEKVFYGEYLLNAQGEDVVAGVRTPQPIRTLETALPAAYRELRTITTRLEKHYRDVQDFEFTIQESRLYMLQTRSGKRTGHAAIRIAVEMVREKLITPQEAVLRVDPGQMEQLLHPVFDGTARKGFRVGAKGLNASPGAAAGRVVFDADRAVELGGKGDRVLLVREETSPDDIHGMAAARGILTGRGGMTSHAAVVSRQMGKPSVVGCSAVDVDPDGKGMKLGDVKIREGDYLSIDGTTGEVLIGDVPTAPSEILQVVEGTKRREDSLLYRNFETFMGWVDRFRRLRVRANADIPRDAVTAVGLGAEGIGLCRTEHMFFAEDRLPLMQRMILARTLEEREAALAQLLPLQRGDFRGLFQEMKGRPVTIRTIDPPLHEFLPRREDLMVQLTELKLKKGDAKVIAEKERLLRRVEELHEINPMMGFRGCRLGILLPEVTRMQARAIFEAALEVPGVVPEIMIPLVGHVRELTDQKKIVVETAEKVFAERGEKCRYLVGTMIEVPRGAITAEQVAVEAEFFSFGTNDLTQLTCGFSRDDAGRFLPSYVDRKIYDTDPFVAIDREGVGALIRLAVDGGRRGRPGIKLGICGEHGGEPSSVEFCHQVGLDYVSCSPYRLPVARLAAARAALKDPATKPKKRSR